MRTVLLLPLALAVATAGGCRTASVGTEQAAFRVPERDLTLRESGAPDVQVASPVELAGTPTQRATIHRPQRARRPAPAPRPAAPAPALVPAPTAPVPLAASPAPEPPDPHALAPGQSVTIIPASSPPSSGPSTDRDWTDQRPSGPTRGIAVGSGGHGHGGGCRPRGGGMGPSARGGAFRDLR
jgi:hypothetical protein